MINDRLKVSTVSSTYTQAIGEKIYFKFNSCYYLDTQSNYIKLYNNEMHRINACNLGDFQIRILFLIKNYKL